MPSNALFPANCLHDLDKLRYIDAANELDDLRIPPGNRLKRLQGKITNTYGIRVNRSWRICFIWQEGNAYNVDLNNHYA